MMEDDLLNKINNNDLNIKDENQLPATATGLLGTETVYESKNELKMAAPNSESGEMFSSAVTSSSTNTSTGHASTLSGPATAIINRSPSVTQFAHQLDSPTNHVVSEKVQNLAAQIYSELQRVISRFNDDDEIVSGMMPLIVNVLESLDLQLIETQQLQVELELLKDDNDQLILAFEKEKQIKKKLEQQLFEYEFQSDEEKQKLHQKIASLENIVKMLELKAKNSNDNVCRLEDEKSEIKNEFAKLHHRNTDLLRSYCDLMERVKILIGNEDLLNSNLGNYNSLESSGLAKLKRTNAELIENIQRGTNLKDFRNEVEQATRMDDSLKENMSHCVKTGNRSDYNNLNELMSMEDNQSIMEMPMDDPPKDTPSLYGMEKEVENLIKENHELLTTKNALNIVKDDLIAQVDELQSQLAFCKEENLQLLKIQEMYRSKMDKCEEELRKNMSHIEQLKAQLTQRNEDSEEGVSMSQRKRFTRVEMARVLMERNQYKEKLMELQEAIKWTEFVRQNNKNGAQEKKSVIWKFFSNLFSNTSTPVNTSSTPATTSGLNSNAASSGVRLSGLNESVADPAPSLSSTTPALESMRRRAKYHQTTTGLGLNALPNPTSCKEELMLFLDNDLSCELKKLNQSQKSNTNVIAYGWCLQQPSPDSTPSTDLSETAQPRRMPVPIYCRPLASSTASTGGSIVGLGTSSSGLRIWCAAAVDLNGGEVSSYKSFDNGRIGDSLTDAHRTSEEARLSTFTWICSVSHAKSKITIVNMKSNPSEILDNFFVKTHLLCICSVPGTEEHDFICAAEEEEENGPVMKTIRRLNNSMSGKKSDQPSSASQSFAEESTESLKDESIIKQETLSTLERLNNFLENYDQGSALPSTSSALSSAPASATSTSAYTARQSETNLSSLPPFSAASKPSKAEVSEKSSKFYEKMSTVLSTMWLGGQNGRLYIHSSVAQWSQLIQHVDLSDSVLSISHVRGRVFVALGNGQLCVFSRNFDTREWNLSEYKTIDVNAIAKLYYDGFLIDAGTDLNDAYIRHYGDESLKTVEVAGEEEDVRAQAGVYAIRCTTIAGNQLWCGYRNLLFVFSVDTLKLLHCALVHTGREQQVRHLATVQYAQSKSASVNFVLSILRLDCVVRIYQTKEPFACVVNCNLEPTINKFLIGNFSSSQNSENIEESSLANERLVNKMAGLINFIRITSVKVAESRIWLGTANGVILTVPHVLDTSESSSGRMQPKLLLGNCQLSFHGHKDSVKFFVAAKNFVLSGGEGYADFRLESDIDNGIGSSLSRGDQSHLILWEINLY